MKKLVVFFCAVLALALAGCGGGAGETNASPGSSAGATASGGDAQASAEASPGAASDGAVALGEKFTFGGLEITFGTDISWSKVDNQFSESNGKEVFSVPVTVKNVSDETQGLNPFFYNCFEPNGTKLDGVYTLFDDGMKLFDELRPDAEQTHPMYIIYEGDGDYVVEFDNFTDKVEVKIPVAK